MRGGERKRMPYENPERRRENGLALLDADRRVPSLPWVGYGGTWRAEHLTRAFAEALDQPETADRPLVVALANASRHHSHLLRAALPDLAARGLSLSFLPPASPELNAIEHVLRALKRYHLPRRRSTSHEALPAAVYHAFDQYEASRIAKSAHDPGLAAESLFKKHVSGLRGGVSGGSWRDRRTFR